MTKKEMKGRVIEWNIEIGKDIEKDWDTLSKMHEVCERLNIPKYCCYESIIEAVADTGDVVALMKIIDLYAVHIACEAKHESLISFMKKTDSFDL